MSETVAAEEQAKTDEADRSPEKELPPTLRPIEVKQDLPLFHNLPKEEQSPVKVFQARNWMIAGIVVAVLYFFLPTFASLPLSVVELVIGFWIYRKGATKKGGIFLVVGAVLLMLSILYIIAANLSA